MVTGPPVSSTTIVCGLAAATWLDQLVLLLGQGQDPARRTLRGYAGARRRSPRPMPRPALPPRRRPCRDRTPLWPAAPWREWPAAARKDARPRATSRRAARPRILERHCRRPDPPGPIRRRKARPRRRATRSRRSTRCRSLQRQLAVGVLQQHDRLLGDALGHLGAGEGVHRRTGWPACPGRPGRTPSAGCGGPCRRGGPSALRPSPPPALSGAPRNLPPGIS